jgi:hypothetical protein
MTKLKITLTAMTATTAAAAKIVSTTFTSSSPRSNAPIPDTLISYWA